MDPVFIELAKAVDAAYNNAGPLSAAAVSLGFGIRVYRSDIISRLLPKQARWPQLPTWAKFVTPFLLAGGGGFLAALSGGASVLTSLLQAVPVALGAIGFHHSTKSIGNVIDSKALKANPFGDTSKLRKSMHLLVPVSSAAKRADLENVP